MDDERTRRRGREANSRVIRNVKTGGDILMYIGSAALMRPQIQRAKENQNGILGTCATGAGIILAFGLGSVASTFMHKAIDKVVDFWDDVKPKDKEEETNG